MRLDRKTCFAFCLAVFVSKGVATAQPCPPRDSLIQASPGVAPERPDASGDLVAVDSIADLRAWPRPLPRMHLYVRGYHKPGDDGGGVFIWQPSSTVAVDDFQVFDQAIQGSGRWIRDIGNDRSVTPQMAGAQTGTGDATKAINAVWRFAAAQKAFALFPCGTYSVGHLSLPGGLKIMPAQPGCVTLRRNDGATAGPLVVARGTNWSIGAVVLDGNALGAPSASSNLLIDGAGCFSITGLRSINASRNGITISGTSVESHLSAGDISGISLSGNRGDGLQITGRAAALTIVDSRADANGGNGFDIGNVHFPYLAGYKESITGLTLDRLSATGNHGTGIALHGFLQLGSETSNTRLGGPGGDAVYKSHLSNLTATDNGHYGIIAQVDSSTVAHVHTARNGSSRPRFFAGLLMNAEFSSFSDILTEEEGLAYGVDAGGCFHCTLRDVRSSGALEGVDLEGARYSRLEKARCELPEDGRAAICVDVNRVGGPGQSTPSGALIGWAWDGHDVTVEGTQCVLASEAQTCVRVFQDPQNITVRGSNATGSGSPKAFIFQCTAGCVFADNASPLSYQNSRAKSALDMFKEEYAHAAYRITITSEGAHYANPVALAQGGCTIAPDAKLEIRPDTGGVVNGFIISKGNGCNTTPGCVVSDKRRNGQGATCRWSTAP